MRNRFQQFMYGRYGMDQLNRFLSTVALIILVVSMFIRRPIVEIVALALLFWCYYRMFSKNISKRYAENQKYLKMTAGIRRRLASWKSQLAQRKIYHIYRCPGCKQKIRVPRGRGKIEIRCPKCNTRFVKKS